MSIAGAQIEAKQVILKVVPTCNIACTYCYQSQFLDPSWMRLPKFIRLPTLHKCVESVFRHAATRDQSLVNFIFQGGEPLLAPRPTFISYLDTLAKLSDEFRIAYTATVQTNGLLLDYEWLRILQNGNCGLAISVDGPKEVHDARRKTHSSKGTFDTVIRNIRRAIDLGLRPRGLCVVSPNADGASVVRFFASNHFTSVGFILPAHNRTVPDPFYRPDALEYGRFLAQAFDEWLDLEGDLRVHNFDAVLQVLSGKESSLAGIGVAPADFLSIASDGSVEVGDAYGICTYERIRLEDAFDSIRKAEDSEFSKLQRSGGFLPTASSCETCDVAFACLGGQLEHRFDGKSYNNPSYYCEDLRFFYRHVMMRLKQVGIPIAQRSSNE